MLGQTKVQGAKEVNSLCKRYLCLLLDLLYVVSLKSSNITEYSKNNLMLT